jgi:hypothetical protein
MHPRARHSTSNRNLSSGLVHRWRGRQAGNSVRGCLRASFPLGYGLNGLIKDRHSIGLFRPARYICISTSLGGGARPQQRAKSRFDRSAATGRRARRRIPVCKPEVIIEQGRVSIWDKGRRYLGLRQNSLFSKITSLFSLQKFPVRLFRESRRKCPKRQLI